MEKSGTFLAVCVFNAAVLLLLSSMVIYHFIAPAVEDPMVFAKVKTVVPPPPKPVSKGGESQKSLIDPTTVVVPPPVSSLSVVATTNPTSAFAVQSVDVNIPTNLPSFAIPSGGGLSQGTSGGGVPQANPFGSSVTDGGTPALVGYFYDLKQSSDNPPQPTGMDQPTWKKEMLKLVANGLKEDSLSKYLKSSDPRTTNGLFIDEQASANAPTAFGLGDKVKPSLWCIVYHAKAIAPEAGRYRFVGFGDDILVILKDGKPILDAGWQAMTKAPHNYYPNIWREKLGPNCRLRQGEWFNVDQGQTINLDVAIGDWGGLCGYFLFLEKEGATYDKLPDGTPKLPLFQLGAKLKMPTGTEMPPSSDSDTVWTSAYNQ